MNPKGIAGRADPKARPVPSSRRDPAQRSGQRRTDCPSLSAALTLTLAAPRCAELAVALATRCPCMVSVAGAGFAVHRHPQRDPRGCCKPCRSFHGRCRHCVTAHCIVTLCFLYYGSEAARRSGTPSRKCAADVAAQAPLGLSAGCITVFFPRTLEHPGNESTTPFGAWNSHPTHLWCPQYQARAWPVSLAFSTT